MNLPTIMRAILILSMTAFSVGVSACSGDTAPRTTPTETSPCQFGLHERVPASVDCDCTIGIGADSLSVGVVEVRFLWGEPRGDRVQTGCTAQGFGGGLIELVHEDQVIQTIETGPISLLGPPYFSNTFPLAAKHRSPGARFTIRASHGSWRSNDVEFSIPRE